MDCSGDEHRLANGELHAAIAQGGEEQQQQQQQQHVNSADAVPSDVAELLVVRHGETTWNAGARLQGHAESDLNDVGKQQAVAVADRLASSGMNFAAVYSSDLRRAAETAQAIADRCQCSKVVLKEALRERNLGCLQGLTRAEARVQEPKAYKAFVSSDETRDIPGGGESLEQLYIRAQSVMEEIAEKHHGQRVVVVSHGGILRSLHIIATGLPARGKVLNASINTFRISDTKDWTMCSFGDVQHLQEVGYLSSAFGGDQESG
ncbi:unnamed protein product [Sphagnum balticum]